MEHFQEEEILGKAYDSRLMRRLLKYARPFWPIILLCIILLLIITIADLSRPYLIKIAIDEHIQDYDTPWVVFNPGENPVPGIEYQGKVLVRADELKQQYPELPKMQIIYKQGRYYLIEGVIPETEIDNFRITREGSSLLAASEDQTFPASLLSSREIKLFREKDITSVVRIGLIFLAIIVGSFILNYIQVYLLNYTGQKIIYNMRMEIFSHLQKLSLSFFENNPVGRLVTRVTNDTQTLHEMYTGVLVNLFKDIFLLLGIIIIMLKMHTRLALVSFVTLPLIFAATYIFRMKVREAYREVRKKLARINATLNENISGMSIVQIFNQEDKKYKEFEQINDQYYQANMKQLNLFAIFRPSMDLIYSLALALLIWYGGGQVLAGKIQFGVLFAFINYIQQFFRPINDLTEKYNILQAAMASSERIFQLLDREEDIKNPAQPLSLEEPRGRIEFKNVWFAYEKDNWVLKDVSFTIEPGETVAFVGATGAGKTSIISLVSRLYDIQKGQILIDGKDIKKLRKEELRSLIGVVLQDVFLFTGDLKSNIRLNNENIGEEKIREVARYVNADKFIKRLPKGYDHPIQERGATLSAGERQLIAFARALAFDPKILVLDEATANIDTETELLIQDALNKLIQGRTTLVVAHRLSTIQHADKIIVLHKGKIREMGNHQELLNRGGIYYDLYRLQYKEDFTETIQNG